mmetsp:Transcript_27656/g.40724  ORF Transcript_27656/g.40724 Transcript_27656/m.40724 type:complete len:106 (+) Transcript_27656:134-451(+)
MFSRRLSTLQLISWCLMLQVSDAFVSPITTSKQHALVSKALLAKESTNDDNNNNNNNTSTKQKISRRIYNLHLCPLSKQYNQYSKKPKSSQHRLLHLCMLWYTHI